MNNEAAIDEAIDWAVKENLLEGLIKEQRAEVKMDLLTDFDLELYDRIRRREGFEEGALEKAIESAKNLLKEGDSPTKVARCTGLPLEKVLELQKEITVNV